MGVFLCTKYNRTIRASVICLLNLSLVRIEMLVSLLYLKGPTHSANFFLLLYIDSFKITIQVSIMDKIINLISLDRCAFDTMKLFLQSAHTSYVWKGNKTQTRVEKK